ncbi:MAG: DNA cytosine methyltransferase, partial [Bacteroidota bacterium]
MELGVESTKSKIGVFSFFSGAGFLDLGFEMTQGYASLLVNEYHEPFMDIYKSSRRRLAIKQPTFGHSTRSIASYLDTREAALLKDKVNEARNTHDFICFIGGPPCPDFSVGGKNKGSDGENGKLSGTYIELIIRNSPDLFLFENVKGLYRTKKHKAFFNSLKEQLVQSGYHLTEKLINAIEYGAPQDRERIILIGVKNSLLYDHGINPNTSSQLIGFPWEARTQYRAEEIFALDWPTQEPFAEGSVKVIPPDLIPELTVEHWFQKNEVINHPNAQHFFKPRAGLSKFQSIDEGDDLKKSYKRLHRWRFSPTAAYGNNEVHVHPYKARRISVADALAIQSLPKEFVIPEHISLSNMFKTIGNGVPFLAARGLAETLQDYLEKIRT